MRTVYLERHEPAQNMARFYRMTLVPTLFGEWALIRE
jgi:predicted DNA-binding WGR domain protein